MFTAQQASLLTDIAVRLIVVVIGLLVAWLTYYAKQWMSAHATQQQQQTAATIASTIVNAVEQSMQGDTPADKYSTADAFLSKAVPTLSMMQRKALIESSVRAVNAGVVELAPGAMTVLPPTIQQAAASVPQIDMDGIRSDLSQLATSVASSTATSTTQKVMRDALGAMFTTPSASASTSTSSPMQSSSPEGAGPLMPDAGAGTGERSALASGPVPLSAPGGGAVAATSSAAAPPSGVTVSDAPGGSDAPTPP